jgi:cysteine-rich repeat protein
MKRRQRNGLIRTVAFIVILLCCWLTGAACVESTSTMCPSGRRCPADAFCAASRDICIRFTCGNGVVDGLDEVCDDGNNLDRDGCSADCSSTEKCGDKILDPKSEACDDGNEVDGDGCQANCTIPLCGDGILDTQFSEACDEGAANSGDPDAKCRFNCQPQRCGDGIQDSGEVCDDGNFATKDGCTPDCQSDETCGNGYVDFHLSEPCDDGNKLSRDGCTSSCVTEKPLWAKHTFTALSSTMAYAMAYDAARGRIVLFGGKNFVDEPNNETWEYDGVAWTLVTPTGASPSARSDHAMAYDAARKRVVLFGGVTGGTTRGDTWAWDGKTWTEVTPKSSPAPRHSHGMTYDAARRCIVLFGGSLVANAENAGVDDTWEWDGAAWTKIALADGSRPPPRYVPAMAYDAARNRVVLYGGSYYDDLFQTVSSRSDTWEWDGTTWTERQPVGSVPPAPPWVATHTMAYDAAHGRIILHSGSIWEWDGTAWTERLFGGSSPSWIREHDMVYDVARDRIVVVDYGTTWLWDGTEWTERTFTNASPGKRWGAGMAYDAQRGRIVLFGGDSGGYTDTWEWDGTTWTERTPAASPPCCAKMVYDAGHERTFLYGPSQTWEWDGTDWTQLNPAKSPPVRYGHAMAYDAARRRVVLFGGEFFGQIYDETWEWDGTDWIHVDVVDTRPPARYDHAMAYDEKRGRVILFGGQDVAPLNDTWEWDGSKWVEFASAGNTPSARYGHAMVYNPARKRIALFGGYDGTYRADTWEWDGIAWSEVSTVTSPEPRALTSAAFDAARGSIVLFGGGEAFPTGTDNTWQFAYDRDVQVYETCIHGFDNDGDGLIGCSDPDCWGYCAPSCSPDSANDCATSFPHCGDFVCNAQLETCISCPQDCGACPSICGDFLCGSGESCPADCNAP